ncbi:putative bifunctional diguanylate cyclase/phosphodiesterase [Devosia beringensis]|uniref:putative bifunctional diguanylate cyclase/phosphodiesterase n=1 Tax=Devosia beringensis TaxID=2657486 RepID=UPI00186BA9D6|nr:EAL domain-containing protein [Devosia beringensis]
MFKRFLSMLRSERALSLDIRLQLVNGLFYPFASLIAGALAGLWIAVTVTILVDDILVRITADIIVAIAIARIAIGLAYIRGKQVTPASVATWELVYATGAGLFALSLGLVTFLALLRVDNEPLHLMLTTTTAAYAASITGRNAGRPWIALSQLYLAAAPMCLGLMLNPIAFYQIVGATLLLFMFGMTDITLSVRQTIVGALETQRLNAELAQASQQQAALFDDALNNMSHGLCMFDSDSNLLVWNQKFLDLLQHDGRGIAKGMQLQDLLQSARRQGTPARNVQLIEAIRDSVQSTGARKSFARLSDGAAVAVSHQTMRNGNVVLVLEDVTEQTEAHDRIRQLAWNDELTGLMNRASFNERLKKSLSRADHAPPLALHLIDLDNFKAVNDTLGHPVGDHLLVDVARRIVATVAGRGHVARLGGDEFVVIQPLHGQAADYQALADAILAGLGEPFDISGHNITIGASIGIALSPDHADTDDVLLKRADMALYKAKANGRQTIVVFEHALDVQVQLRRQLELDIRVAMANDQFSLAFQPIVEVASGRITALEALIRWQHPSRGLVSPAEFIPVAEDTGQIIGIGRWVVEEACRVLKTLDGEMVCAVNFSAVQFQDKSFPDFLAHTLQAHGIKPARLEFEITETALLDDSSSTRDMLAELGRLGVGVSLDDFGTGYSSLSHLRTFPFTKIKIDGSFVQDLPGSASAVAVIRAVCNIGQILGIAVVAEGVETQQQLQFLSTAGCSHVQGYLLGRPAPQERLATVLAEYSTARMRSLLAA